jgi:predicted metal-dependent peptidase
MTDLALANKALDKAKIQLMSRADSAFFTTLCFSLKFRWDTSLPTAATNGLDLIINPDFFMSLSQDEQVFLLLHESLHPALMHICRIGTRNHMKWNAAGDYVINHMLIERGFKMPKGGLHDPKYAGMSTDEVYDLLSDSQECPMPDLIALEGEGGAGDSGMSAQELEDKINDMLIRAQIQSKMSGDAPGSIPGMIQIYLDNLLTPKLPWYQLLRRWLTDSIKDDYSFRKPNRRFLPRYYMPTLFSDGLGEIAIAVDASGSVSDMEFKRFVTEAHQILKQLKPKKLSLIQFDAGIRSVDQVDSAEALMRLKFHGRGGTLIQPVLDWANEHKPKLLLIFSDGYFRHVPEKPKSNVLWLIHNNPGFTAPYGKVIHYQTEVK